jgi:hypothetical protein
MNKCPTCNGKGTTTRRNAHDSNFKYRLHCTNCGAMFLLNSDENASVGSIEKR